MSDETIKPPIPYTVLAPELNYVGNKAMVKFNGRCLTQNKIIFYNKKIVNMYIVYDLILHNSDRNYPTLERCLFGSVQLARCIDIDNYKYFGCELDLIEKDFFQLVLTYVEM